MYKSKQFMVLKALTPMHAGGGNEISVVDLPIQREIHTNFPKIEASTIKGCVRAAFHFDKNDEKSEKEIFGTEEKENMHASAVSFTDAKILFFPVRSAKGIFAYVTCPFVLNRFLSDLKQMEINFPEVSPVEGGKTSASSSYLLINTSSNDIVLEEYTFKNVDMNNENFKKLVSCISDYMPDNDLNKDLINRSVLLSDDEFLYFAEMSTDVITRIKVEVSTGTTDGGLFDEEYLPAESILYSLLFFRDSRNRNSDLEAERIVELINETLKKPIQIGGNATLGKGFTACKLSGNGGAQA